MADSTTSPPAYADAHTSSRPVREEPDGTRRRTFSREHGTDGSPLQDVGPNGAVKPTKSSQGHHSAELTDSDSKL